MNRSNFIFRNAFTAFFFLLFFIQLKSSAGTVDGLYFKLIPTTITLSANINPSCLNATVDFTATVSESSATGNVEFFDGATSLGIIPVSAGVALFSTTALSVGSHAITAVYSGDGTYDPSTSSVWSQSIDAAVPVSPGAVSGLSSQCPSVIEQIYSIAPVVDATFYNWTVPSGWSITNGTGTETISVTTGLTGQNGNITVSAANSCGVSATISFAVTVGNAAPATPGAITGGTGPYCTGVAGLTYSVLPVANATSYNWNLPSGWIITAGSGTNAITVTSGTASGNIAVTAGNACGNSAAQTLSVSVTPVPPTPGSISGPTLTCPSVTGLSYSIAAVPGATSYAWTLPSGWSITAGINTIAITATSSANSGNILVAAVNSCGSSAVSNTINLVPVVSANTTGYTDGTTKFSDGITVSNVTTPVRRGYLKFLTSSLSVIPIGATVSSILRLTHNASGNSPVATNTVNALGSTDPETASAASLFSASATGANYSTASWTNSPALLSLPLNAQANTDIVNSAGSTGYIAFGLVKSPTGATVVNFFGYSSGSNVPVLSVTYAFLSSLAVTVSPATPAAPGAITGPATVCPNATGNIYSIVNVANATSYNWTVPAGWSVTAGAGTNSITVTAGVAGGNISVRAVNSCGTSAAGTPRTITISALPTLSATPATQSRCSGTAIGTITASSGTATSYTWVRDNLVNVTGMAASGSGATINGTLLNGLSSAQTVNFSITAFNALGCASAAPFVVSVTVDPNPVANAGADQGGCAATPVTIGGTPTASGGTAGYSYLWSAGVSNTAIANPTATPGTYTVTVTDSKGCVATDAVTVINSTGTKTWIGSGSTTGGGVNSDFNNPSNWSPAGVPGACNDVVMNFDIVNIFDFFGAALTVSLSGNCTIRSLAIDVNGTTIFGSGASFKLEVGSRTLNVLNATTLNTRGAAFFSSPARSYISVGAGGVLTYGGNLTTTISNNCSNFPFYATNNNTGTMYLKGSVISLAGIGNDAINKPARIVFDGTGLQTVTNNAGAQVIYLSASTTDIGETNAPTVVLAGPGTLGFRNIGDLNVNANATLDIGTTQTMNRNNPGGNINLAAGSFLKLGRNTGGVGTSNFPSNYSTYNFNTTSTVEYNASTGQAVFATPQYGSLTLSNSGNKTAGGNITAKANISIAGSAIFMGGANTITLAGNWSNYGQVGFSEQTSIVDFNGTGAQTINTTGGEIFYSLRKTAAGTTTLLSDVAVQGGGTSSFTLSNGTFDAGTFSFNSASSSFNISNGLLRLARTGATLLPEFAVASYNNTGGTIELYGAGDQVLRGSRDYRNLTFSVSGLKTISSPITTITGTVLTQNAVTVDVSNNSMGGAGTNLTMTGTSVYKTGGTGTKPDAQGTYTLGVGTTVEFTGTGVTTEDIRLTAPTYYNLVVSGTNVANPSATTGIKMQAGGTFTVKNGGIFKLGNNAGFTGAVTTAVANTNNPSIVLETGSTVEYYGGVAGTNPQLITNQFPYHSLTFSGTSIKTAPAGIIMVSGNLGNNSSGFSHSNGTVLLNGTALQQYNSTGTILAFYNVTNTNPVDLQVNGDLSVVNLLSLGTAGKLQLASGNIILRSGISSTASVDKITIANSISYSGTGRFIHERFIPTGINHGKSWQFLSTPAFGQSVNATWQAGNAPLANAMPGFGTTISSSVTGAVARGYDFYTSSGGPSIKTYNATTDLWEGIDDGITNTASLQLANPKGYMIFVRGDRSVQTSVTPANTTVFRTIGKLYGPGVDAPPASAVAINKLQSVGNPYASAIDFINLTTTSTGIDSKFYVWDPLLPGGNGLGLGGYQLLSSSNLWMPVPGGTTNYPTGVANSRVQSGQAFFVYSTPGGNVTFDENNKVAGSQVVFRQQSTGNRQFLRSYLYGPSGIIADGNVVAFDPEFSGSFDADDAIKIQNATENFYINDSSRSLALNARKPVNADDTLFFAVNHLRVQTYTVKIVPEQMSPAIEAFFVDRFTGLRQPLSLTDSNSINFEVTSDPLSVQPDRFYIIFKPVGTVPVSIVNITADRITKEKVVVEWKVEQQINIRHYQVERSLDGVSFTNINTMLPQVGNGGRNTYSILDNEAISKQLFYRIKAVSHDSHSQYSKIVKVAAVNEAGSITVAPNPVKERSMNIRFIGQQPGKYNLKILNGLGQVVHTGTVTVVTSQDMFKIQLPLSVITGTYNLSVTGPGFVTSMQQVFIQ